MKMMVRIWEVEGVEGHCRRRIYILYLNLVEISHKTLNATPH
jgi:hypothetical protein